MLGGGIGEVAHALAVEFLEGGGIGEGVEQEVDGKQIAAREVGVMPHKSGIDSGRGAGDGGITFVQESNQIRHCGARAAHALRNFRVCQRELFSQPLERPRLFR